jgi:cell division initiation protein
LRLTALDIQNHPFSSRFRGLDPIEVETFLRLVAEDFESLVRECEALRARQRALEAKVADLSANEQALRETLLTAQALSEDLKRTAVKESELLISEAEVKGERILDAAHRRAAKLAEDIREMKALRTRLGAALRATIDTHLALLDSLIAEPAGSDPVLEGKVAYLTRRAPAAGEA